MYETLCIWLDFSLLWTEFSLNGEIRLKICLKATNANLCVDGGRVIAGGFVQLSNVC